MDQIKKVSLPATPPDPYLGTLPLLRPQQQQQMQQQQQQHH